MSTAAGMQISKSDIQSLKNRYQAAATKLAHYKHQANAAARQVIHGVEASGTAFLCGMANGYWGGAEVLGVPAELLIAGGAVGLSFALDDDLSEHLQSVGLGATCAYATQLGMGVGAKLRDKKLAAGVAPGAVPAPATP